jgi:pyridoxine 4-dehydrogenase
MTLSNQAGIFRIGDLPAVRLGYGALRLLDVGPDASGPPAAGVDSADILARVIDLGINLIDTGNVYGPGTNEEQISAALHPYRDDLIISTKGGLVPAGAGELYPDSSPGNLKRAVEGSLQRLKLDRIDLWTLHRIDERIPVEEIAGTLSRLRDEGKIREIGLSEVSIDQLRQAQSIVPIACVQNRLNATDLRHDALIDYCEERGIGFMAWFPLAPGRSDILTSCLGDIAEAHGVSVQQMALAWLLHRSPVILPIPGTAFRHELEANVAACAIRLSADEMALIAARQAMIPPAVDGASSIKQAPPR